MDADLHNSFKGSKVVVVSLHGNSLISFNNAKISVSVSTVSMTVVDINLPKVQLIPFPP